MTPGIAGRASEHASLTGGGALTCMLGLAAVRVWIQCILFDSYTQSDDGLFTIINNLGYGGAILAGALVALRRPPCARTQERLGWAAFTLMALAPLGLLAIPGQLSVGQMVAVGLLAGVAGGMGAGVWTAVYARLGVRQIVLYGMSSLALGSIGGLAVSFMAPDPGQIVSILMAALAQMCYRRALKTVGPSDAPAGCGEFAQPWLPHDPEPVYDREPRSTTWLILGGLAVFGFALGLSRGYPAGEPITMGPVLRALHQLGVAGLALFVMHWTIRRHNRLSFTLLWRIEIGVAALGALSLSIMPDDFDALAIAIENIADSFMLGVLWITMADTARHSSRHAYTVFGIAWAVRVFSREAGRVLILVLGSVNAIPQAGVVIGALTAAIGASMALLLSENVPHTRAFFSADETEPAEASAPAREGAASAGPARPAACAPRVASATRVADAPGPAGVTGIAGAEGVEGVALSPVELARMQRLRDEFNLSEREAQVAALIAQGRSKTAIARHLYVSENTVRTHAKNAYAKLGVRSKAELEALLESLA